MVRKITELTLIGLLLALLAQCTRNPIMPERYVIVCARDFAVAEYSREHPKGQIIYQLDEAGAYMITSVAYEPRRKIIAVAVANKEPQKGTASIRVLDEKTSSILKEIPTGKDYIRGMSIDGEGRIAFAANDMHHDQPGELCYLSITDGRVYSIAKGKHFSSPTWSKGSKRVYFSYVKDSNKRIANVELNKSGAVNQIDDGLSVSVSGSGKIVYLTDAGDIILMQESDGILSGSKQKLLRVDPRFADSIRFVKGTEDIILQRYKKSIVYDLLVLQPPYTAEKVLLPNAGLKDYDVAFQNAE